MWQSRRLLVVLALAAPLGPAQASTPAVETRLTQVVVETRTYDSRSEPPEDMPVQGDSAALTVCDFWCKPILSYRTVQASAEADGCRAEIEFASAEVILELTITSWLPEKASPALEQQEAAHREICERTYRATGLDARKNATERLTGRFAGFAEDCKEAVANAVHQGSTLSLCVPFTSRSGTTVRRVSDLYDSISRLGERRDLSVARAIDHAFKRYVEELAPAGEP